MPVFRNDPTAVSAGFTILPRDDYEFIIGNAKAFYKTGQNGKADNHGVRYGLVVASGPMEGKKSAPFNGYQHSEDAQGFTKQFLMAALGYDKGREEEARFDADQKGKDWGYDTDSGSVGDAWQELVGKRIVGSYDIGINTETGAEQQKVLGWRKI
jgi:hypothetical protein